MINCAKQCASLSCLWAEVGKFLLTQLTVIPGVMDSSGQLEGPGNTLGYCRIAASAPALALLCVLSSHRVAAGQNSSCGPAGRRHYHEDRKWLEEAQHPPALPGTAGILCQGFILIGNSVDGGIAPGMKATSSHFLKTQMLISSSQREILLVRSGR